METLDEKNSEGMSPKAFYDLTGTAGWLKITSLVGIGMMAVGILLMLWAMTKGAGGQVMVAVLIYVAIIGFYFLLFKQGKALASYQTSKSATDLEEFAKNFKTFWTIAGVLAILGGIVWVVMIVMALGNGGRMF